HPSPLTHPSLPTRRSSDLDQTARTITILSHEFVHSWNGKYRRPAGLATADYQQPMIGELLFVYEGMTRYLGDFVISARSGMRTRSEEHTSELQSRGHLVCR